MPKQWIEIIEKHGINVSTNWSIFYFTLYTIKVFISGLYSFFISIFLSFENINGNTSYIQFVDLNLNNLPSNSYDTKSNNIINWYIDNVSNSISIKHNVPNTLPINIDGIDISSNSRIFPALTFLNYLKYLLSVSLAIVRSLLDLLMGKWWHPFMFKQSLFTKRIKFTRKNDLAKEYLFSNSNMLNRPLWTYEAYKRGSDVTLYFYSTNCEYLKYDGGDKIIPIGYSAMNWPNYLVWDIFQFEYLNELNTFKSNINIVGPIWFESKNINVRLSKSKSIAIFDVSPIRDSLYSTLSATDKYYSSNNCIKFIEDIIEIANKYNYRINFKIKRQLTNKIELKYINFLNKLKRNKSVSFLDPDTSAIEIIEKSEMTISMPYTSTSIIAKEYGYKCCYYDSTGKLNRHDSASHGVNLIRTKEELEYWIVNN